MSEIQLSERLFVIPDGGDYILYEPLKPGVLLVNKAAVQVLQDFQNGDRNRIDPESGFGRQLKDAGILYSGNQENQPPELMNGQPNYDPGGVSLFLSTKCSMRCIYCYSNGGDHPRIMPWPIAKASLDWIIQHVVGRGKDSFYVSFHGGGEVTTVIPLVQRCVAYIRQKAGDFGITARIEAGLNGIMNRRTVEWIVENLDGATVSLDGLPEVQNMQRPLSNGKASFPLVARTLQFLDAKGFKYAIRTTVTQESLHKLADSVAFMAKTFGAGTIQLEPIFMVGRALQTGMQPIDPERFVAEYRKASKLAGEHGTDLKYSGARLHTRTNTFCKAATGSAFAVTPEGFVTACYEVAEVDDPRSALFFFGKLNPKGDQFEFDPQKIQQLRSLSVENKAYCRNCFCKWHCAGDCPAKLALLGDAWDPSSNPRCHINRELTKDQIKASLAHNAVN